MSNTMMTHFLSQYSPATAKVNEQALREAEYLVGKPLTTFTQEDAISYQSAISSCGKLTQKRKLSTLNTFFKYAIQREWIDKNPMVTIRLPKVQREKTITWLREEEAYAIMDTLEGQEKAVVAAGFSGLRVSEIANLNADQFHHGRLWDVLGKGDKVRTVPLTKEASEAFSDHLRGRNYGPMFSLKRGQRISVRSIQNIVSRASRKALGRHIHPHALRHTFVTLGAKADIPIAKLSRLAGHESPLTTQLYIHLDDDDLEDEVRKLDRNTDERHLKLVYSEAS